MQHMGFNNRWIQLVLFCISTTTQAVIINGKPVGLQKPTRGIRQGDPLSPYIFILYSEVLSASIQELENKGKFAGLRISRNGPPITHLMFADDLLICGKTKPKECKAIMDTISTFSEQSGLQISKEKSLWYHHKKLPRENIGTISKILRIHQTTSFGKYLGAFLEANRCRESNFKELLEKTESKLAGWKGKLLNKAGRITLINSVMAAQPNHIFATTTIPKNIKDKLERCQRNFFWGHNNEERKLHTIAWRKICTPRISGGLGIRDMEVANRSMLAKRAWELLTQKNKGLSQILQQKYHRHTEFMNAVTKGGHSQQWKWIIKARTDMIKGVAWKIGDGSNIKIWKDKWLPFATDRLIEDWKNNRNLKQLERVSQIIHPLTGRWDEEKLEQLGNMEFRDHVLAIHRPITWAQDSRIWGATKTGMFSVKSMANLIHAAEHNTTQVQDFDWTKLWKIKCQPKITVFIWRLVRKGLTIGANLAKRNIPTDNTCSLCNQGKEEDEDHLFLTCSYAKCCWFGSPLQLRPEAEGHTRIKNWINYLIKDKWNNKEEWVKGTALMAHILWNIWLTRNKTFFEGKTPNPMLGIQESVAYCEELLQTNGSNAGTKDKCMREIKWRPPGNGGVKINCDGASKGNPGKAGIGVVIRDEQGKFLAGGAKTIGHTSALVAEAMALLEGLRLYRSLEIDKEVHIELDSLTLIQIISNAQTKEPWALTETLEEIMEELRQVRNWKLGHRHREGNQVADTLANFAIQQSANRNAGKYDCTWVKGPPNCIKTCLLADVIGVTYFR